MYDLNLFMGLCPALLVQYFLDGFYGNIKIIF